MYGVTVIFKDKDNYLAIEDILDRTYGLGTKPNRYIDVQYWKEEETFITFSYRRITNVGSLAFIGLKVDQEVADDRAAKNHKRGKLTWESAGFVLVIIAYKIISLKLARKIMSCYNTFREVSIHA